MKTIPQEPAAEKRSGANNPSRNHHHRGQKDRQFLPLPAPALLEAAYREWDDLPVSITIPGFPHEIVASCGYKFPVSGSASPVKIPRRQIVVAVRNTSSQIVGLHNAQGEWFTARSLHFANLRRVNYTNQIEVYPDTVAADVAAMQRNVATVALNGLTSHDLQLAISHLRDVRLDWRVAA